MKIKIAKDSARTASTYDNETFDVTCSDREGRQYWREVHSKNWEAMLRLAGKVNECGEIDSQYWTCHVPYGSLAWELDGCEYDVMLWERETYR